MRFFKFFIILFALVLGACNPTVPVRVNFAFYNSSADVAQFVVDGKDVGPEIPPSGTHNFRVSVEVPSPGHNSTAPIDQVVTVTVAARNLRTNTLSMVQTCSATARRTTNVIYETQSSWGSAYTSVRCQ
jgi:hypothetical protein